MKPVHRLLVHSGFLIGYVLGFYAGRRAGRIAGASEALLNVIAGHNQALAARD
jgi:hypothetical protein